jgi:hypothetical protein
MKRPAFIDMDWVTDFYHPYKNADYDEIFFLSNSHRSKLLAYTHYKMSFYKRAVFVLLFLFGALNTTMIMTKLIVMVIPVAITGILINFSYIKSDLYKRRRNNFLTPFLAYYREQFLFFCNVNDFETDDDYYHDTDKFMAHFKKYLVRENYWVTHGEGQNVLSDYCYLNLIKINRTPYRPQFHIGI